MATRPVSKNILACCFLGAFLLSFAEAQFRKPPYLQNASPRSVTLMWHLTVNQPCTLEYYIEGQPTSSVTSSSDDGIFEVTLENLTPGATYDYRIFSPSFSTNWYEFKTPPLYTTKMRFTFTADCEDNGLSYRRMERNLRKQALYNPDFFLVGGDLVDRGDGDGIGFREDQWSAYFKSLSILATTRAYWPAAGNHDVENDYSFSNYLKFHSLPGSEEYYSFRYGSAHFVSLSIRGCAPYSWQYLWLETDLATAAADSTVKFIFVFMHFGGYSSGYYNDRDSMQNFEANAGYPYPDLRRDIYPLFDRYRVSAVFAGHDHHYERTHKIHDNAVNDNGIFYFIAGGGGSWNNPTKPPQWWTAQISPQREFLHFLLVDVNGDSCSIRCIPVDSTWAVPYDSVAVTPKKPVKYEPPRNADNAIILYPSPTRDLSELFYYGPVASRAEYRVFNILGQEVLREEILGVIRSGMRWRVDLKGLPSGIYFCRLVSDAMTMQTKLVKIR